MKIAIVGGGLKGLEAVYLAIKAGMETVLVDKRENVPARGISNSFFCTNVFERAPRLIAELKTVDCILPALDNKEALEVICSLAREHRFNIIHNMKIPSCTPTAVYYSTGINFIKELTNLYSEENKLISKDIKANISKPSKYVSIEHFLINNGQISAVGEHVIKQSGPMRLIDGFCGADEVLTNYKINTDTWIGRFIYTAETKENLQAKRKHIINKTKKFLCKSA